MAADPKTLAYFRRGRPFRGVGGRNPTTTLSYFRRSSPYRAAVNTTGGPGPLTPGSVSTSSIGPTHLTISCSVAGGGTAPYNYQFQQAPDVSGSPGTWANIGPNSTGTSYTVTGLTPSTLYWYRVVVTDAIPNTANSAATGTTTPASLTDSGVTFSSITRTTLTVTAATASGGVAPDTYQFQRAPDAAGSPGTFANIGSAGTSSSYNDSGLSAGATYWYRVVVTDSDSPANNVTSAASSVMMQPPLSQVTIFNSLLTTAQGKPTGTTNQQSQWTAFKSQLDASLNSLILPSYEEDYLDWAANYALGYQVLKSSDPTTSQHYADKAIGLINSALYGLGKGTSESSYAPGSQLYLGRGTGSQSAYTIPNADYVSSTLLVMLANIATVAITKGSANGADYIGGAYRKILKVSNTNDGTVDYASGTDWVQSTTYWADATNKAPAMIDWSPGGSEPAVGTTYYVTYADLTTTVQKPLTTDYIVSGTTVTFGIAPTTGEAVFVAYLYGTHAGDYSTLAYQQTVDGLGGTCNVFIDDGFPARTLYCVSLAANWLWGYGGMTSTLKSNVIAMCESWNTWFQTHGFAHSIATSNYGAGGFGLLAITALMVRGNDSGNDATLDTSAQAWYTGNLLPQLAAPSTNPPVGTEIDGHRQEGWNYGPAAVANLCIASKAYSDAGLMDASAAQTWAGSVIKAIVQEQQSPGYIYDGGDNYSYPAPSPKKQRLYPIIATASDVAAKAYGNFYIQHDTSSANSGVNPDWYDLLFRDPDATATNWTGTLDTAVHLRGGDLIVSRADWSYGKECLYLHCGNLPNGTAGVEHEHLVQGDVSIWYGTDGLLVIPATITGDQFGPNKSRYGNTVLVNSLVRSFPDGVLNGTTTLTSSTANFTSADVGRTVYDGNLIPNNTTISTVTNSTTVVMSQAAGGSGNGVTVLLSDPTVMTYPAGVNGPAQGQWYTGPNGCSSRLEKTTSYRYLFGDYGAAYGLNYAGTPNPTSTLTRQIIHLPAGGSNGSALFVFRDLAVTTQSSYTKELRWHFDASGTTTLSGDAWVHQQGSSKLFGATFSPAAITSAKNMLKLNGASTVNIHQVTVNLNSAAVTAEYLTVQQAAPSSQSSADPVTYLGVSGDGTNHGVVVNHQCLIFPVGNEGITGATSYSFNESSGATTTHYIVDLQPSTTYTLAGGNQTSATSSSQGVLTFTTTGTGSPQTVSLAVSGGSGSGTIFRRRFGGRCGSRGI